mmetsp:Transcript_55434/g.134605  ORF Transcript_55434/g.134605 Transcript_55434/m.134605 type:complete len:254 (-) Transcript_55434:117-878(-)|eukprot:CAMPEP_0113463520 /NCGR_PEP_ID=MMETSP0014_2-20120614/12695_1 /TAXON_ID=2857 /ORGANISM="Nitzschia sp." /LENGTH=253 /DNA_ID=CAMNT_0000355507 /DNA_START=123 /DNA_END=887 /DNA_ORIENTATION=- /assembly_acc=CAM_ASM_000159
MTVTTKQNLLFLSLASLALTIQNAADAFVVPTPSSSSSSSSSSTLNTWLLSSASSNDLFDMASSSLSSPSALSSSSVMTSNIFDGVRDPVQSYADIWIPLFQQARDAGLVPDFLLHWGHGAAMSTVLLSMGLIGSYFGWQIRLGNGNDVNALTLGETVREMHPKILGGALFFFLLGGQGGLVLLAVQGQEILNSPHAITALVAIAALIVQATLPLLFEKGGQTARDVHAYLGSATIVALFAHMGTGINLGLSF